MTGLARVSISLKYRCLLYSYCMTPKKSLKIKYKEYSVSLELSALEDLRAEENEGM
jgi:hypothetical protein